MAVLDPEHFFEQADKLASSAAGAPRQVDLRRAISAAYYGVFHAVLTAAADQFIGASKRTTSQYNLAYRSVDHSWLRSLCDEVKKPTLRPRFQRNAPSNGFGPNITAFADALIDLQEKRHEADYDPTNRIKQSDAIVAIKLARAAVRRFNKANDIRREAFLALLLFPPR